MDRQKTVEGLELLQEKLRRRKTLRIMRIRFCSPNPNGGEPIHHPEDDIVVRWEDESVDSPEYKKWRNGKGPAPGGLTGIYEELDRPNRSKNS